VAVFAEWFVIKIRSTVQTGIFDDATRLIIGKARTTIPVPVVFMVPYGHRFAPYPLNPDSLPVTVGTGPFNIAVIIKNASQGEIDWSTAYLQISVWVYGVHRA
jgi:hypothetical protein